MKIYFLILFGLCATHSAQATTVSVVGAWKTDCVVFGRHSYISLATFTEDHLTIINRFFENTKCTSHSITGTYEGNFALGEETTLGPRLVHMPTSSHFTLHLQQVVDQWNSSARDGCEMRGWRVNEAREVSGKFCFPFHMPQAQVQVLDIISIQQAASSQ